MSAITLKHFSRLVKKAQVPEYLVLSVVREAVEETIQAWHKHKADYPLPDEIRGRLDQHIKRLMLAR